MGMTNIKQITTVTTIEKKEKDSCCCLPDAAEAEDDVVPCARDELVVLDVLGELLAPNTGGSVVVSNMCETEVEADDLGKAVVEVARGDAVVPEGLLWFVLSSNL